MVDTRDFPTEVIASISTGFWLCEGFDKMYEAAEWLMGHPIWTHQFADENFNNDMRRSIAAQCPGMATKEQAEEFGVNGDNALEFVAKIKDEIGPIVSIRKGSGLTAM